MTSSSRVLYLLGCAAPPVRRLLPAVGACQQAGWNVAVVLTPTAHRWLQEDIPALEKATGHPVRHQFKLPDEADVLPSADAILAAPVTFNTLNKWADGHADTLVLGLLTEAIGLQLPVVALPYLNAAQAAHPALGRHVDVLRGAGVDILLGDGGFIPHIPKHGDLDGYPWDTAIAALPR
ncbi:flavoprotein [Streptacidiphilus rugosus]|uniref:flavoprotein n=1 Tax=Streptacidiphilus rugosus TaxID=405783 RepID=UPI00055CA829|nr:flavoprotein [Streptacidiphilus rugosus]